MGRITVKSIGSVAIVMLSLLLLNGCGSSSAETKKNPTIESDTMLDIDLFNNNGQLSFVGSRVIKLPKPNQMNPKPNGDHMLVVVDKDGKAQYITFFSVPEEMWGMKIDEATGRKIKVLETIELPAGHRVPVNADTREIYILNPNGERIIDIPFDPSQISSPASDASEGLKSFKAASVFDELLYKYPLIRFRIFDELTGYEENLSVEEYATRLLQGLDRIPSANVIGSIEYIIILRNSSMALLGGSHSPYIFIREEVLNGSTNSSVEEVLVHESAHRYIDYMNKNDLFNGTPDEPFADMMTDLGSYWDDGWSDIESQWASLQEDFGAMRAQADCPGESYVAAQFSYGNSDSPANATKEPSVDLYLHNGFVPPYASTDVSEDIADTYTFAVLSPDFVANKVEPENIYDQKLQFLTDLGMLPEENYNSILAVASNVSESKLLFFSFRFKGISYEPLSFFLNGNPIEPSFIGTGSKYMKIENGIDILLDSNELALSTKINEDGDADDIEVQDLRMESPRPISASTGCDQSIVYLDAPEPVHLGNGNCSADAFCDSYSELKGYSYSWTL